ncbi:MAG TPA: hypothetical protein VMV05_00955, partial [bacterium]|nr:hypothetical protein [bacterium]
PADRFERRFDFARLERGFVFIETHQETKGQALTLQFKEFRLAWRVTPKRPHSINFPYSLRSSGAAFL